MVNPMEYRILLDRIEILQQELKELGKIKTKTPEVIKRINSVEFSINHILGEVKRIEGVD
jgi:hypothetical protein